jgi:2-hydroxychromene-2-carboxylate isomerase
LGDSIPFLFDYVSPYAYLASTRIRALADRHGCAVEPIPVLFAAMLDASGARGPAEIPLKRDYMHRDVVRLAASLGVPIEPPASHPFNPLAALRVTTCVEDTAARWRLVDALYRAAWVEGRRVDQAEIVAEVATRAGFDGAALAQRSTSPEVKTALRTVTEEAIAAGVFGVPTMLARGELFWGVDSLALLDRFLGGENVTGAGRMAGWRALQPSATRR